MLVVLVLVVANGSTFLFVLLLLVKLLNGSNVADSAVEDVDGGGMSGADVLVVVADAGLRPDGGGGSNAATEIVEW